MSVLAPNSSIPSFWRTNFQDKYRESRPRTTTALPPDDLSDVDEVPNASQHDVSPVKTEFLSDVSDGPITNEQGRESPLNPYNFIRRPFTSSGPSSTSVPMHSFTSPNKEIIDLNSPSLHQERSFSFFPNDQINRESLPNSMFAIPTTNLKSNYRAFDVGTETRRHYLELSQIQNRQRYANRIKSASPALLDTSTLDSRLNFTMERLERSIAQLSKNTMRAVSHLENPPRDIPIPKINSKHAAWPLQQSAALPADSSKSRPYSVPAPSPSQSEEYEAMKSAATYSPARTLNKQNPPESPMPPLPSNPTSPSAEKQEKQVINSGMHSPNVHEPNFHPADDASTASSDAISRSVHSFQPLPNSSDLFFKLHLSSVDNDIDSSHQQDVSVSNSYNPSSRNEFTDSPAPYVRENSQLLKSSPFRGTSKSNANPSPQEDVSIVSDYNNSLHHKSIHPQTREKDIITSNPELRSFAATESAAPRPASSKQQTPKASDQAPKKKKKSKLEKLCCIIA
ncbi:Tea1 anchoring protein Mod5 [Schizosaccharomyces cryophilus OY26]|uniref:Tea1 anchoring protein Mod5 n=1 Tax=Schizosaccharomyces cryophilus (strain OY26 / ATCC MYA-4695 / CBS 11777 / NBRC 106824 / NRRL Y48691) TaxID=653667 RepID=S9VNG0_SCHCR|nr:Tea1 anchoring protein Mod5 [Schizosaccharomyces cryophilus OY26]EPY49488.1 Tea1 anchoring protein Mod5 [Schizosaccharomyces cryophilus OY26]